MKRRRLRKPFQIIAELILVASIISLASLDNFQLSLGNLSTISILLTSMIASASLLIKYGKGEAYDR